MNNEEVKNEEVKEAGEGFSGKKTTDAQDIEALKNKYAALALDNSHRERGMALDLVVKSLAGVQNSLKIVTDVEKDIKERAAKAAKLAPKEKK